MWVIESSTTSHMGNLPGSQGLLEPDKAIHAIQVMAWISFRKTWLHAAKDQVLLGLTGAGIHGKEVHDGRTDDSLQVDPLPSAFPSPLARFLSCARSARSRSRLLHPSPASVRLDWTM